MSRFLDLARAQKFADAAAYLELPKEQEQDGPRLAQHLIAVLDRYDWGDLEKLSPAPNGNLDDGLPPNFEQVGTVPKGTAAKDPVRLIRRGEKTSKWMFTRATVQKVDGWYASLPDRWFLETLPAPLLREGPRGLLWWQWIALPVLVMVALALGVASSWGTRKLFTPIARRTRTKWDDSLMARLGGPLALAFALIYTHEALPTLSLYLPARIFMHHALRGGVLFTVFWGHSRIMDVGIQRVVDSDWSNGRHVSRALISLVGRVGKVVVAALAVVAFLSELGYPVTSLIAGLGIGGLAVALAAQKTMENLFGAFSIGADQPFREGDLIKVDDVSGTVESIGLRSTRIRTPDRTIVTIPNGKLADARIESFAARDRIRFAATLGLSRDTSAHSMEKALSGFEAVLREHPKIWPTGIVARFTEIRDAALNVEITCWFQTNDFSEFQLIRQTVLLALLKVVEDAGTTLASSVQTLRIVEETSPSSGPSASLRKSGAAE
jgi:MscS family membrane protein